MNIRSLLFVVAAVLAVALHQDAFSQATGANGGTQVDETTAANRVMDGLYRINGGLYLVNAGVARRVELAEGQMITFEGLVKKLPAGFDLAKIQAGAPATGGPSRASQVGDPTPGATSPSSPKAGQ